MALYRSLFWTDSVIDGGAGANTTMGVLQTASGLHTDV